MLAYVRALNRAQAAARLLGTGTTIDRTTRVGAIGSTGSPPTRRSPPAPGRCPFAVVI